MTVRELIVALAQWPNWNDEVIVHYDGDQPADIAEVRHCTASEAQERGRHHVIVQVDS